MLQQCHRNLAPCRLAAIVNIILNLSELDTYYDYQYCLVRYDRALVTEF